MTDLRTLLRDEYKDISLSIDSGAIIAQYRKQRRKKATVFVSTAVCLLMAVGLFFRINPNVAESLMNSTGAFLSGLIGTADNSVRITQPAKEWTTASTSKSEIESKNKTAHSAGKIHSTTQNQSEPNEATASAKQESTVEVSPDLKETQNQKAKALATEPSARKAVEIKKKTATARLRYVVLSDGTVKITACVPTGAKLVIPEKLDGLTVTELGGGILEGYYTVTEVVLPNTVATIGNGAFKGLGSLNSVTMSQSIKTIGSSAFENCAALKAIDLKNVQNIGSGAFRGCSSLSEVTVPKSAKIVGSQAFSKCESLTTAYINSNCDDNSEMEKSSTFSGCSKLEEVRFGDNVTAIGSYAFYQCCALKNISFSSGLKQISESAFSCCTSISKLNLPNGVILIGKNAFYKNRALSELTLPESLNSIGSYAFYGCPKLTSVTVPKSVELLSGKCLGYTDSKYDDLKVSGFTIKGYSNSKARVYAVKNGFNFDSIGTYDSPTTITLDKYIAALGVGDTCEIKYTVENPKGNTTFTSSDTSVATVSADGVVTAKSTGQAVVNVENNGALRQFVVIVA